MVQYLARRLFTRVVALKWELAIDSRTHEVWLVEVTITRLTKAKIT